MDLVGLGSSLFTEPILAFSDGFMTLIDTLLYPLQTVLGPLATPVFVLITAISGWAYGKVLISSVDPVPYDPMLMPAIVELAEEEGDDDSEDRDRLEEVREQYTEGEIDERELEWRLEVELSKDVDELAPEQETERDDEQ